MNHRLSAEDTYWWRARVETSKGSVYFVHEHKNSMLHPSLHRASTALRRGEYTVGAYLSMEDIIDDPIFIRGNSEKDRKALETQEVKNALKDEMHYRLLQPTTSSSDDKNSPPQNEVRMEGMCVVWRLSDSLFQVV